MSNVPDPFYGYCEAEAENGRCHYPGTFNASTTGGGKWLCRAHSSRNSAMTREEIIQQSHRDHPSPDYSLEARRNHGNKLFADKWAESIGQTAMGG